ncbi:helix-turn-helix domain-containing protein [Lactobacillus delbrueckii]|uniref:helix-turn-helix domain-containing protein n=1 Tax=Lactobacillus delbrueckii TaxID=1584 RepID=UPI001E4503CE|nr:helix-turn-helix domain-containing protein [Lactobacillus delbrueckii]
MKIGEALRKKRLELGLTQQEICEGILSRPFYAKVESGKIELTRKACSKYYSRGKSTLSNLASWFKERTIRQKIRLRSGIKAR